MFKLKIVGKINQDRSKEEIKQEAEIARKMFEDYENVKMDI